MLHVFFLLPVVKPGTFSLNPPTADSTETFFEDKQGSVHALLTPPKILTVMKEEKTGDEVYLK